MGKDWVVWLGCVLLFSSGVVWAGIPIGTDFFVVEDIHDLVEMIAASGTFGAAIYGLNAWRSQLHAASDLELAKRLAVELMKYKNTAAEAFDSARFVLNQYPVGTDKLPDSFLDNMSKTLAVKLSNRETARAALMALILEAKAVWGREFGEGFNQILNFVERCNTCGRAFVDSRCEGSAGMSKLVSSRTLTDNARFFSSNGWDNRLEGRVLDFISQMTADIEVALQRKMHG